MFAFTFGDVGSGKSLDQAKLIRYLLKRSIRIEKKYKLPKREVWVNLEMSEELNKKYEDRLRYWTDPMDMIFEDYPHNKIIRRDFDCVWDEIAVELPADKWSETDQEIRRFFAQHRKRGIQIFANTQDYRMLDINARRMATEVYQIIKVIGNRDPSPTLPPIKHVWGIIFKWELDKQAIRSDDFNRIKLSILPQFLLITKKLIKSYATEQDISKAIDPPFKHRIKKCYTCGFEKVIHT